jgi:uncharacterized cofD-like protein
VIAAIEDADAIVFGPGSVFTSIIPNLLVDGVVAAVMRSSAVKIYVCNVMTQPGETDCFKASDHIRAIVQHAGGRKLFTHVLVNKMRPAADVLAKYEKYGQKFVEPDLDQIRSMGYTPWIGNYISETAIVRHDSGRLAKAIYDIMARRYGPFAPGALRLSKPSSDGDGAG